MRTIMHMTAKRITITRITATAIHKQDKFAEDAVNDALDSVLDNGVAIRQALSDVARLLELRARR